MILTKNEVNKFLTSVIFVALFGKLINAPFVAGNFASETGGVINYSFDFIILFAVLIGILTAYKKFLIMYAVAIATGFSFVLSTALFSDDPITAALISHLKIYLPLMIFPILLKSYYLDKDWFLTKVKYLCGLVSILLLIGLIFFPTATNRLETWWPSFFGGLHTTAYIALIFSILIYCLAVNNEIKNYYAGLIIIAVAASIYFGWGVRTATIATMIFIAGVLLAYVKDRILISFVVATALLFVATFYFLFLFDYNNLDMLSSGRLAMYGEKYDQLMKNSVPQWFIGNGAGSDLIATDVWWWAEKGAHSDFITILVEGGLLYLLGFVFVLCFLLVQGGFIYKTLVLTAIFTSIVSNGIFLRPLVGYLLVIAMVTISDYKTIHKMKKINVL